MPESLTPNSTVDLAIHGVVGVRLIGATAEDSARLQRQLGATRSPVDGEPDIVIRFKDHVSPPIMTYLGSNSAAFAGDQFFVLEGTSGEMQAQVPFDRIGGQCELTCPNGIDNIPFLMDIVRLNFLSKQYVPLHASAFRRGGMGILVLGWAMGGKTETLLAFANHGAEYVGDDWVILSPDGLSMFGVPVSVAVRDWHVAHIPGLLPRVPFEYRALFALIRSIETVNKIWARTPWSGSLLHRKLGQALPSARKQLMIRRDPRDLFGNGPHQDSAPVDKIFLTMTHSDPNIRVTPTDPVDVARRIAASVVYEHGRLLEYYEVFRFAFPHRRNVFLDELHSFIEKQLCEALAGKVAYEVLHPYPFSFEALFEALDPLLDE